MPVAPVPSRTAASGRVRLPRKQRPCARRRRSPDDREHEAEEICTPGPRVLGVPLPRLDWPLFYVTWHFGHQPPPTPDAGDCQPRRGRRSSRRRRRGRGPRGCPLNRPGKKSRLAVQQRVDRWGAPPQVVLWLLCPTAGLRLGERAVCAAEPPSVAAVVRPPTPRPTPRRHALCGLCHWWAPHGWPRSPGHHALFLGEACSAPPAPRCPPYFFHASPPSRLAECGEGGRHEACLTGNRLESGRGGAGAGFGPTPLTRGPFERGGGRRRWGWGGLLASCTLGAPVEGGGAKNPSPPCDARAVVRRSHLDRLPRCVRRWPVGGHTGEPPDRVQRTKGRGGRVRWSPTPPPPLSFPPRRVDTRRGAGPRRRGLAQGVARAFGSGHTAFPLLPPPRPWRVSRRRAPPPAPCFLSRQQLPTPPPLSAPRSSSPSAVAGQTRQDSKTGAVAAGVACRVTAPPSSLQRRTPRRRHPTRRPVAAPSAPPRALVQDFIGVVATPSSSSPPFPPLSPPSTPCPLLPPTLTHC